MPEVPVFFISFCQACSSTAEKLLYSLVGIFPGVEATTSKQEQQNGGEKISPG